MTRGMSREERRKVFLAHAEEIFEEMEAWYDEHPNASFGEIEEKARQLRREAMGKTPRVIINGQDTGHRV